MTGMITDKKSNLTTYLSKSLRFGAGAITASLVFGQISCAPIVSNVGYVFDEETLNQVTVGSSNKEIVRSIMGSPSTIASVDGAAYYYIASRIETNAYKKPKVTNRGLLCR